MPSNDAFDYTPQQALTDALDIANERDADGAVVILFSRIDSSDAEITHFISGATAMQVMSCLDVLKTRLTLQVLGR